MQEKLENSFYRAFEISDTSKICILCAILIILTATTIGSSHYFSEALSVQFPYNRVNLLWHWIPFHYTYTEKSVLLLFYHGGNR